MLCHGIIGKEIFFKIVHVFVVSLTTDGVLDLVKYNYLHLATPKIRMCTVFSKGFIDPIWMIRLICVFNGLDVWDKCLYLKTAFATLFLLTLHYNGLDVFRISINMPAKYRYIRLLYILRNCLLYAFCDHV